MESALYSDLIFIKFRQASSDRRRTALVFPASATRVSRYVSEQRISAFSGVKPRVLAAAAQCIRWLG